MTADRHAQARARARELAGVVPYLLDAPDAYCVPSASATGRAHLVLGPRGRRTCSCPAGANNVPCWHVARVAAWLGEPDDA